MPKKLTEYRLVSSDSGDYYVIPADKQSHWYDVWMYSDEHDNGETPTYAKYVQENKLVFKSWRLEEEWE